MRPKSAVIKRTPQHQKPEDSRYDSSVLRTQYLQIHSRINKNTLQRSSISKMPSVKTVNNIKSIGIIHAYQPSLLKTCLVKDKRSYITFFNKAGDCKSPDIFLKSIITHFRQWKKDINQRLRVIFDLILTTDYLKQEECQPKIREILAQLQQFSSELKQNLLQIMKTKAQSPQISQLLLKYQEMQWVIKRVILLMDHLFKFISEVNQFLTSNKEIDIHDTIKISNQLQSLSKKHMKEMADEMNYCHSLTQNEMLLKLEYRVRQKMAQTNRRTLQIFQSMKAMRQFQKTFKNKLATLQNWSGFDCEYLQNVVEFLYYKNEEIKLNQKRFDINPKIKENIYELRSQIEAIETNFVCQFQKKCFSEAKLTLSKLSELRTLHLVKNRGKQYIQIKKKMLLIVKVLQQSQKQSGIDEQKYNAQKKIVAQYITVYSKAIKNMTGFLQSLIEKMQTTALFKDRSSLINSRTLERSIKEIIEVEELQRQIWKVVSTLMQQLCEAEGQPTTDSSSIVFSDSQLLIKFNQLVLYSRNEKENNQIFHLIDSNLSERMQRSRRNNQPINLTQNLFGFYASVAKSHQKFVKTGLQQGIIRNKQLKQLNKQEIIQHLFANEFENEFISNYPSIKNMATIIDKLHLYVQKEYISHVQFYVLSTKTLSDYRAAVNEQIKNMDKSKFKYIFNKYIVLLYENSLIRLLNLPYINKLQAMRNQSMDTSGYSKILTVFIEIYQTVLSKTKKDANLFTETIFYVYEMAKQIHAQNNFIESYSQSYQSGIYYPSWQTIKELIQLEYSVHIEQTLSRQTTQVRKQQIKSIFGYCIKKLQATRQKIKLKLLLNEQHSIYGDINQTTALLKNITFEQDYIGLLNKLLLLLRVKHIHHSALFAQDGSPVYLLPYLESLQDANSAVYSHFHSHSSASSGNIDILGVMCWDDSKDIISYKNTQAQQNDKSDRKEKSLLIVNKQSNRISNQDQMDEQIIGEQSQLQIDSHLKQSIIQSLIQSSTSQIHPPIKQPTRKQPTLHPSNQLSKSKHYCYYTLKSIRNINLLTKCMFYRNHQIDFIKQQLQLCIICNLDTPTDRNKAITHIHQILRQANQSDLIRRMGVHCEQPQCQLILKSFEKAVKLQISVVQSLQRLLECFEYRRQLIFLKGSNKMQLIHQQNKSAYIRVILTDYTDTINIGRLQIAQFLSYLWQQMRMSVQLNSKLQYSQIREKYNLFISVANKQLKSFYAEIEQQLKQHIKMNSHNAKQAVYKIDFYLKNVVGCQSYLSTYNQQLNSPQHVLNLLTLLSASINRIKIFAPHHTLHYKQHLLYLSAHRITDEDILSCMMIHQPIEYPLPIQNTLIRTISYEPWLNQLNQLLSSAPITLLQVKQLINQWNLIHRQPGRVKQKMDRLNKLMSEIILLKITDSQIYSQMSSHIDGFKKQAEIYSFVEHLHQNKKIYRFGGLETNSNLKYNDRVYNITNHTYLHPKQLTQLHHKLKNSNIPCYQLFYRNTLIDLLKQISIQQTSKAININLTSNCSQYIQLGKDKVVINKLLVTIANIVPTLSQKDPQIIQAINQFIKNTTLQINIGSSIQRYDCHDLQINHNKLQLQVDWQKQPIHLKLSNHQEQIELTILPNNYLFFMQIEAVSLQKYISQKYRQIRYDINRRRQEIERIRQRQRIQREEQLKQAEKKEVERQLEILQIEQNKLKIKLENEQIQNKMREMQEQKARRQREETIRRQQQQLKRLRQQQEQQARQKKQKEKQRQKQLQLQRKREQFIQKIKDKTHNNQQQNSQIDVSVILSQGNSVRNIDEANFNFPGLSNLKQCEQQLEYELTLSQDNFKPKKKPRT